MRESKVDPDSKKLKCNEHSDLFLKNKKNGILYIICSIAIPKFLIYLAINNNLPITSLILILWDNKFCFFESSNFLNNWSNFFLYYYYEILNFHLALHNYASWQSKPFIRVLKFLGANWPKHKILIINLYDKGLIDLSQEARGIETKGVNKHFSLTCHLKGVSICCRYKGIC